jgi:16S rRNA (guanine966-N2)-methyltransferase
LLRITGGRARGRKLAGPKGEAIRPTSDKVRAAIFDLIGQDLQNIRVLDLFAGTGALGMEALSRGAASAVFVDISPRAVKLIARNLELCGFGSKGSILRRDLTRGVPWGHPVLRRGADLVFLDPPYGMGLIQPLLSEFSRGGRLTGNALVVAESSKAEGIPKAPGALHAFEERVYGDTRICIYHLTSCPDASNHRGGDADGEDYD